MRIVNANVHSYSISGCTIRKKDKIMSTTLTSPPVAPLIEALFADAAKSTALLGKMFGHLSREERAARMSDPNADYRAFYGLAKEIHMPVSADTGVLLYM